MKTDISTDVQGTSDDRFTRLGELLQASIDSDDDLGASVAVTIDGEAVVDIWGGWADADKTQPWQEDTITNVFSSTKPMTALAALLLVDRGELDLSAPVSRYWPEFGCNGKESVEVRHLLGHTSGVSGWQQPVEIADVYDPERSIEILAAQAPWWEPGTASGYHGTNYGHLIGEVIRRITGETLGSFFAKEIAEPLGADFHIGLDPAHDHRVSNVVPPPPLPIDFDSMDKDNPSYLTLVGPQVHAEYSWTTEWRRAEIGAAGGHGNARSVATIQSIVSNGGVAQGRQFLSEATIDMIFVKQSDGIDLVLGIPLTFGTGFALPRPDTFPYLPQDSRVCFWGGWGGSMVINDLDRRMTFAYMMNKMEGGIIGGPRSEALIRATYDAMA